MMPLSGLRGELVVAIVRVSDAFRLSHPCARGQLSLFISSMDDMNGGWRVNATSWGRRQLFLNPHLLQPETRPGHLGARDQYFALSPAWQQATGRFRTFTFHKSFQ